MQMDVLTMNDFQKMELNQLLQELNICTQSQYTGELKIKDLQSNSWSLYYELGQIIWSTGGIHPHRRWLRNISQYCPDLDIKHIPYSSDNKSIDYWDYLLLIKLYSTQQITHNQVNSIIESTISEILFALIREDNLSSLSFQRNQATFLEYPLISTDSNIYEKMQNCWYKWKEAGLVKIYPDSAPILRKPEQLQLRVSSSIYKNFERLMNGKYTLWDLSAKMKQSILSITISLQPFIKKEILELIKVNDLSLPVYKVDKIHRLAAVNKENSPLVACVDDSSQVCKILERIITAHGMKFIGIQNPLEALPILLENQPDLIFLDLIMPQISGYEICNRLRRNSRFVNTPIVILTGSNRAFDQVRSHVFGATEFINKPIEIYRIIEIVDKYLVNCSESTSKKNLKSQINAPKIGQNINIGSTFPGLPKGK